MYETQQLEASIAATWTSGNKTAAQAVIEGQQDTMHNNLHYTMTMFTVKHACYTNAYMKKLSII